MLPDCTWLPTTWAPSIQASPNHRSNTLKAAELLASVTSRQVMYALSNLQQNRGPQQPAAHVRHRKRERLGGSLMPQVCKPHLLLFEIPHTSVCQASYSNRGQLLHCAQTHRRVWKKPVFAAMVLLSM